MPLLGREIMKMAEVSKTVCISRYWDNRGWWSDLYITNHQRAWRGPTVVFSSVYRLPDGYYAKPVPEELKRYKNHVAIFSTKNKRCGIRRRGHCSASSFFIADTFEVEIGFGKYTTVEIELTDLVDSFNNEALKAKIANSFKREKKDYKTLHAQGII